MTKPKVLILRGENLNPWEMQNYETLKDSFDLVALLPKRHLFDVSTIRFPVREVWDRKSLLPISLWKRFVDKYWENAFFNFEACLEGVKIVHSAEVFNWYTKQALDFKDKFGYRVVLTVWENIPFKDLRTRYGERVKARARKKADLFLATSERARQALVLEGFNETKIKVLFPGVDTERFKPDLKSWELLGKYGFLGDEIIILSIGRLVWEKGIFDLVLAARRLLSDPQLKGFKLRFLLIGDGPEYGRLMSLINRLQLRRVFVLERNISYALMPSYHNLADIFVLNSAPTPSWQEQFGISLVESMACGKAVVAGRSGSIPEILGEAGSLVWPSDHVDLRDKLKPLILEANLRNKWGKKARERALQVFSAERVSQKIKRYYLSLLKQD